VVRADARTCDWTRTRRNPAPYRVPAPAESWRFCKWAVCITGASVGPSDSGTPPTNPGDLEPEAGPEAPSTISPSNCPTDIRVPPRRVPRPSPMLLASPGAAGCGFTATTFVQRLANTLKGETVEPWWCEVDRNYGDTSSQWLNSEAIEHVAFGWRDVHKPKHPPVAHRPGTAGLGPVGFGTQTRGSLEAIESIPR